VPLVGIPATSAAALQGHQALNLTLVTQGITQALATKGHQRSHGLFVPLNHKFFAGGCPLQELGQAATRFFDA
jgi:hypothetical protein